MLRHRLTSLSTFRWWKMSSTYRYWPSRTTWFDSWTWNRSYFNPSSATSKEQQITWSFFFIESGSVSSFGRFMVDSQRQADSYRIRWPAGVVPREQIRRPAGISARFLDRWVANLSWRVAITTSTAPSGAFLLQQSPPARITSGSRRRRFLTFKRSRPVVDHCQSPTTTGKHQFASGRIFHPVVPYPTTDLLLGILMILWIQCSP